MSKLILTIIQLFSDEKMISILLVFIYYNTKAIPGLYASIYIYIYIYIL